MKKKVYRTATINHNHQVGRVRINLVKTEDGRYIWEDTCLPSFATIAEACKAAIYAWGSPYWDLKAKWRP